MNEINLLVSTFERYCHTPQWHYLQAMFRLVLKIGYDEGLKQAYKNMEMNVNDDEQQ